MKAAFLAIFVLSVSATSAQTLQKPASGTKLRKAVLDGLRPAIERDLKQKVIFVVDDLRVYGDWAFCHVHPVQPSGKQIDFSKTKYKELLDEGMFDGDSTYALLKLSKGKWVVKTFAIGPTDVTWVDWCEKPYFAPKNVLPPPLGPK